VGRVGLDVHCWSFPSANRVTSDLYYSLYALPMYSGRLNAFSRLLVFSKFSFPATRRVFGIINFYGADLGVLTCPQYLILL